MKARREASCPSRNGIEEDVEGWVRSERRGDAWLSGRLEIPTAGEEWNDRCDVLSISRHGECLRW